MIPLAADVNFHGAVIRGVLLRNPEVDVVRLQDVGLGRAPDPEVLEWCAAEHRALLTHDVNTMIGHAKARMRGGARLAGLLLVNHPFPMTEVIEDILLVAECSEPGDLDSRWLYLPLR